MQILIFMLNLNNNNQVNLVKVSIIISKSSLSILLTPDPLSICSDFPIFLGKMCNFFLILSYIFLYWAFFSYIVKLLSFLYYQKHMLLMLDSKITHKPNKGKLGLVEQNWGKPKLNWTELSFLFSLITQN